MRSQVVLAFMLTGCVSATNDGSRAAATTSCLAAQAGEGFSSQAFDTQTANFSAELDATPSISQIDSVVGLANGAASEFSELAAIVRFNPSGTIDVRDGSTYRADVAVAYSGGTSYHFKLDVDLGAHRYSVSVRQADGSNLLIANGYAFRSEQANVAQLDHVVSEVDSATGTTDVCAFTIDAAAPPPPTCTTTSAGSGFATQPIGPATGVLVFELDATPSNDQTDAVIAVSNGTPASFDSLAAAVRFAPSGEIDARDGATYRATTSLAYHAGTTYHMRVVVDVSSHTFSAFVETTQPLAVEIAHDFAFRPSQATVTRLDTLASNVDTSDGATLQLCNLGPSTPTQLTYVRDGKSSLALLPNDELVSSDGIRTMRLDAHGNTVAQAPYGGEVAVDSAGNIAIASAGDAILSVFSYTPNFDLRWVHSYPVDDDEVVVSAGYDTAGDLMIATTMHGHVAEVTQLAPDGSVQFRTAVGTPDRGASAIALMPDGFAYAYALADGMAIQHQRSSDGQLDWSRSWTGDFTIFAMASDAAGDVVFSGQYYEDIDFAPGVVTYHPSGEVADNTYVTVLGPDTSTVFAVNAGESFVRGVATNGTEVAVSGEHDVGPRIPHLIRFARTGQQVNDLENAGLGDFGLADRTWLAASGRAYWGRTSEFPRYQDWPYYVALPAQ